MELLVDLEDVVQLWIRVQKGLRKFWSWVLRVFVWGRWRRSLRIHSWKVVADSNRVKELRQLAIRTHGHRFFTSTNMVAIDIQIRNSILAT